MGAAGLIATTCVGVDAARMFAIEGVLSLVAAAGLHTLRTGRPGVRTWVPVLAAYTGTGAMFAWGLFQSIVSIVPNDLVTDVPPLATTYAVTRCGIGVLGGLALMRRLR